MASFLYNVCLEANIFSIWDSPYMPVKVLPNKELIVNYQMNLSKELIIILIKFNNFFIMSNDFSHRISSFIYIG